MAKGDDIEDRLIDFAVRIIRVCEVLPDTPVLLQFNRITPNLTAKRPILRRLQMRGAPGK